MLSTRYWQIYSREGYNIRQNRPPAIFNAPLTGSRRYATRNQHREQNRIIAANSARVPAGGNNEGQRNQRSMKRGAAVVTFTVQAAARTHHGVPPSRHSWRHEARTGGTSQCVRVIHAPQRRECQASRCAVRYRTVLRKEPRHPERSCSRQQWHQHGRL